MRLLDLLAERYPDETREQLFSAVLCGDVKVDGGIVRDPKQNVPKRVRIDRLSFRYVSRGALKLERALELWDFPVGGRVFIDAGCSTGGFTDLLLRNGAAHVYAVDVGFNQLAFSLRNDSRVTVMEKTNILSLDETKLPIRPHSAVADISFRSVIAPTVHLFRLISGDEIIVLLKPQFEWKNPPLRFNGVISDRGDLADVLKEFSLDLVRSGLHLKKCALSPIKGGKGNAEFLLLLHRFEGVGDPYAALTEAAAGVGESGGC